MRRIPVVAINRVLKLLDRWFATDFSAGFRIGRGLAVEGRPGWRDPARALVGALLLGGRLRRGPLRLTLNAPRGPIDFVVPDFAGLKALSEVFISGEYDAPIDRDPRTILDLGGHIGASALLFRRRWPNARIVVVEASPSLVDVLRANTRELDVEVRHAAVAEHEGTLPFVVGVESWASSAIPGAGDRTIAVPAVRLDDLIDDTVDLVKIDIEGGEFDAIPASRALPQVPTIIGEIHAPPRSAESRALLRHLDSHDITTNDDPPEQNFTVFRAMRRT